MFAAAVLALTAPFLATRSIRIASIWPGYQLGRAAGDACQHRPGSGFGVHRVALAPLTAKSAVRAWNLKYVHAAFMQVPGQAGA